MGLHNGNGKYYLIMGLFGLMGKNEAQALITKALVAARRGASLVDSIKVESLDRAKSDVQKWRDALEEWEGIGSNIPDRYEMMQIYAEIIQDDSVATHLTTIVRSIEGTEFQIGTQTEKGIEPDEAKKALFESEWFEALIRQIIEAEMQGFTLIEVLPAKDGNYTVDHFKVVPRHYVIPEWQKVRTRPQVNMDLIDYNDPKYTSRLMRVGDRYEKGLFNNLALLYIYKKNAMGYWSNYQSKFGIPPIVVKTDLTNQKKVDSLTDFMRNMRSNTFTLIGFDDEVEALNGVDADAYQTFNELIQHCDKQIAKVLEGQTMTSADGSSRSQAEVHERIAEEFHQARLRRVERIVNSQLIPIIRQDIPGYEGLVFRFSEKKNVDDIIDRVVKLKDAGYQVDRDYLIKVTGMPMEEVTVAAPTPPSPPQSVMAAIEALYNSDDDATE